MSRCLEVITSADEAIRNTPLESLWATFDESTLWQEIDVLDQYRRTEENLYRRVRALFFLASMYRYHVPTRLPATNLGKIPFEAHQHLLQRRFAEAIDRFLLAQKESGPSDALASAIAEAYHRLAFQTLADQVRRSVRSFRGNQWMFRIGHPADHPLRVRKELKEPITGTSMYPFLREKTSVRMDFSHSAWSDIFFLGMDYPEGARVLNVSVDLGVRGRDAGPRPPIETYLRVIDQPVFRLVSVDLGASTEIHSIHEMFDFARDYLGLLKGAVIASGLVPPGLEGCQSSIKELFEVILGPGLGLELVSQVNEIPKGSRLAVSTNLLGSLISICMRATGQVTALTGGLQEPDRRIVAARAILGEWLGGSGGGWQDSGGIWPGIKLIQGVKAEAGDPEYKISRGRLMPQHTVLDENDISAETRQQLQASLVIVHGGMAQNVGPILEMVTEHYLLRGKAEWEARKQAMQTLDDVVDALRAGDVRKVGEVTTRNFCGPLQTIIPWATNRFTDALIEQCREKYKEQFWGFWMLGGMSGGGMGFIFDPAIKPEAQVWLQQTMSATKRSLQNALPFAMEPVVYDFAINNRGAWCELVQSKDELMLDRYYALMLPQWLRLETRQMTPMIRAEMELLGERCRGSSVDTAVPRLMIDSLLPKPVHDASKDQSLQDLLESQGFDAQQHEQLRIDLRSGRVGLAQNRLPANTNLEDVRPEDVIDVRGGIASKYSALGERAIRCGEIGVLTLAAGVGSRWTDGAGVCKALHPFYRFGDRHRSFLEVHLAKNRAVRRTYDACVPHIFSTGYLTHRPIETFLQNHDYFGFQDTVHVSPSRSVGLRMIPTVHDLHFAWEEMPQQMLDEQQQKVRESLRAALIHWARQAGEANDYTDNKPLQCLHPVGHWYEIPNLLRNGVLLQVLTQQPQLKYLLLHNIDTLGASVDPAILGRHIDSGNTLSFEVISRRLEDRGGGLARVNGRPRLVEGLAMPNEAAEFELSFYNSMTTWIEIDGLLKAFGLQRSDLQNSIRVEGAVRRIAQRVPTYITLKDVKKRWGHGQEDVFPVSQFEKLWGDMTTFAEIPCGYLVTHLKRGQQLKHPAQLDGWRRDGSAHYVDSLCDWRP